MTSAREINEKLDEIIGHNREREAVELDYADPDITLEQAVNAKGGGVKKLARHGTAALLSAAHPDVAYPYTEAEVIDFVQAGDVDPLAAANELGCPIN